MLDIEDDERSKRRENATPYERHANDMEIIDMKMRERKKKSKENEDSFLQRHSRQ